MNRKEKRFWFDVGIIAIIYTWVIIQFPKFIKTVWHDYKWSTKKDDE